MGKTVADVALLLESMVGEDVADEKSRSIFKWLLRGQALIQPLRRSLTDMLVKDMMKANVSADACSL